MRFLLHKRCHSLFGGLDWHLVNAVGDEYSNLLVRRSFASGETTFCTAQDDLTPARMTHKLGQLFSDVHWGSSTYRYNFSQFVCCTCCAHFKLLKHAFSLYTAVAALVTSSKCEQLTIFSTIL